MEKREFLKVGLLGIGALAISRKVQALEYYPNPSDKKWAVLYGTWCGSSRDVGVWISEGMGGIANVFDVREKMDLTPYDHLVVGGSIRSGKVSPLLQEYLEKNRDWIKDRVRGLFAVCGNMQRPVGPEQTEAFIHNHLAKLCGVADVPSKVFLGRMTFGLLEPEVRPRMEQFTNGIEYDHLKRADCLAFGKEILEATR
jgi:menaquinone-dependent protoporphyrinogen IX oxidase